MLTLFTAAAVLAACAGLRCFLNRPERKDAFFWGGRIRLTALWNDGAAFSLPLKRKLVTALSILILPLVWVFRRRSPIGAGLALGGGLSNLWERLRRGAVYDYVQFPKLPKIGRYVWNLADLAILIGGLLLVEMSMSRFLNFTRIESSLYYGEILIYLLAVIILSFLFALMPLSYFRRRTLQETIKGSVATARPYLFRRIGIIVQLIVSLAFIFCTVVIMKQLHFLKNTDLGMERHHVANVALWNGDIHQWAEKIKALPMVTETLPPAYFPIIPTGPMMYAEITNWDGLPKVTEKTLLIGIMPAKEEFFKFYDLKLLEGEFISEKSQQNEVVVDESTCLKFGWKHALGKTFGNNTNGRQDIAYKVVGVVKNFSYRSPTSKPGLIAFQRPEAQEYLLNRASILFKFKEGTWNECREAIEKLHKEEFPHAYLRLFSEEEEYGKYLRSEDALMKLLSFVSLVCVLISVFGIFSLVTLSCEQRQKEIAIRKVNGAQIRHILQMFFREYFLLLIIAAVIAFPMGYVVMRQWIETYVRQTAINGWVYVGIFVVVAVIILLCIIWCVWKAARQNPAEVIKNE